MSILKKIIEKSNIGTKMLGILIDPDHLSKLSELQESIDNLKKFPPDFVFIGGSLINNHFFDTCVTTLKEALRIPIIIFPGNNQQISPSADALLLLSLVSGRNPEFLIGQHVQAAFELDKSNLELLSTSYLLIDCGATTSAQYMSNTTPIPYLKNNIAAATALASKQIGTSICYLDGGSGAEKPISSTMISTVKKTIKSPLIVGGGIRDKTSIKAAWAAGADLVIIGTAFEENPSIIAQLR